MTKEDKTEEGNYSSITDEGPLRSPRSTCGRVDIDGSLPRSGGEGGAMGLACRK